MANIHKVMYYPIDINLSYLLGLVSSDSLCSDYEQVKYTAHCHQWWEVTQLQMVFGVLGQHTSLQVGSVRDYSTF